MENQMMDTRTLSLEQSLENLYQNSLEWHLEVDLWKQELKFFQKLIDCNVAKFTTKEQKQRLAHFQNLIIYYNGELLDQFRQKTRRCSKYLAKHIEERSEFNFDEYQQKFGGLSNHLSAFASEFRKYKKDFFQLMEGVMIEKDHRSSMTNS